MIDDEWAAELILRLVAVEDRQRNYGMHDGDCPARDAAKASVEEGQQECTCWLSEATNV